MRFVFHTKDQRFQKELEAGRNWHRKFTWLPTRMTEEPDVLVWLEFVLRKGEPRSYSYVPKIHWNWQYRESSLDILKHGK